MRIHSIDFMRGIAIFLMICTHVLLYWLYPNEQWVLVVFRLISNPILIPNFVLVSGIAFGYSWRYKIIRKIPQKEINRSSLRRTASLCVLSFGYNIIVLLVLHQPWYNLWAWYILQTIWFSRLLGMIVMKFHKVYRVLIASLIWGLHHYLSYFTDFLLQNPEFVGNQSISVVRYAFFHTIYYPLLANSPMIFFPIYCIGTILGEGIAFSNPKIDLKVDNSSKLSQNQSNFYLLGTGIGLVLLGFFTGVRCMSEELGWNYIAALNLNPVLGITCLPGFLIRGSTMWAIFSCGWCVILFFFFHRFEQRLRQVESKISACICNNLEILGQHSLKIYLFQYIFYFLAMVIPYRFPLNLIGIPLVLIFATVLVFVKLISRSHQEFHPFSRMRKIKKI